MGRRAKDGVDSRDKIIHAAVDVFAEKGKHGARMEEMAARAGVNKAMVYYYYSTKDSLFQAVLAAILKKVYDRVFEILGKDGNTHEDSAGVPARKVARLLDAHLTAFSEDVRFPKILLHALANEPRDLKSAMRDIRDAEEGSRHLPEALLPAIAEGIPEGESRGFDASHALISIIGMSLVNFIDKPIAETLLNQRVENETFRKERGKSTVDLVLHGVLRGSAGPGRRGGRRSGAETRRGRPKAVNGRK